MDSKEEYSFQPHILKVMYEPSVKGHNHLPCPLPRSGHRVVIYGSDLYSFGGYNPAIEEDEYDDDQWRAHCPLFRELWKFNLYTRRWRRLESVEDMPNKLASHAAVPYGSFMVVYGGTGMPFGEALSNSIYLCHLPREKWQCAHTTGDIPQPMYGQGVCLTRDVLYTVGGTKGFEYSLDVHKLDLKSMVWTYLKSEVNKDSIFDRRYRHEVIEHNGNLIVFGGGTREETFNLLSLPSFNLETRQWHKLQTYQDSTRGFPKQRKCHILLRYKNFVFIQGGTYDESHLGDLWQLDLRSMQWLRLMKTVPQRKFYFHGASITQEGCIYLFGGMKTTSTNRTNQVSQIWVDIPPLQTMAWEAMLHYTPNIINMNCYKLLSMGIPAYIVKAIGERPSDVG